MSAVRDLGKSIARVKLDQLALSWCGCTSCPLSLHRSHVVFFRGNPDAKLVLVSEAPDRDEDARGDAFAGPVGRLIGGLLAEAKASFDDVCAIHMIGCRTPTDRAPSMAELSACWPRTLGMLTAMNPSAVLMFGLTAAKLAGVTSIGPWRGMPVDIALGDWVARGVVTHGLRYLDQRDSKRRAHVVQDIKVARAIALGRKADDDVLGR